MYVPYAKNTHRNLKTEAHLRTRSKLNKGKRLAYH